MGMITVREAINEYLKSMEADRPEGTYLKHRSDLTQIAIRVGHLPVAKLTAQDLERCWKEPVHGFIAKGLKPNTLNNRREHLMQWITWCQKRGYIKRDRLTLEYPDLTYGITKATVLQRHWTRLTAEQMMEMLDTAPTEQERILCAMAMYTGMRVSDLLRITWGDIDFEAQEIPYINRKTGKASVGIIDDDLMEELRQWRAYYAREIGGFPADEMIVLCARGKPVERNPATGHFYSLAERPTPLKTKTPMHTADTKVKEALYRLGFTKEDVRGEAIHCLRRSAARAFYEAALADGTARDEALEMTRDMLGHSDVAITQKYIGLDRATDARRKFVKGRSLLRSRVEQQGNNVVVQLHREAQ